jgi:hypothetical protein
MSSAVPGSGEAWSFRLEVARTMFNGTAVALLLWRLW